MIRVARATAAIAVLFLSLGRTGGAQEAKSVVSDLMTRGKSAFNDVKYKLADSLGRKVLSYSALLTPQQKIEAMQLVVAATYPEDDSEQKPDIAIDFIKQLLTLGATKGIPRELSWAGLDSLFVWVQRKESGTPAAAAPAPVAPAATQQQSEVRLASPTPEAFLYVNDKIVGPISSLAFFKIPGGESVKLSIRSARCQTPWDTTITVAPGAQQTIGRRMAKDCQ